MLFEILWKNNMSVEILEKSRLLSKFSKNVDFGRNFRKGSVSFESLEKSRFHSKFSKNLDFARYFRKISTSLEIYEKSRYRSKFLKKICFRSKFSKNLDIVRNSWKKFVFGRNFRKISIADELFENPDFGKFFEKSLFRSKFSKNLYFGRNFRKILISVEIFETSWFRSKFSKNLHLFKCYFFYDACISIWQPLHVRAICFKLKWCNDYCVWFGQFCSSIQNYLNNWHSFFMKTSKTNNHWKYFAIFSFSFHYFLIQILWITNSSQTYETLWKIIFILESVTSSNHHKIP